jgi:hypothetical protein
LDFIALYQSIGGPTAVITLEHGLALFFGLIFLAAALVGQALTGVAEYTTSRSPTSCNRLASGSGQGSATPVRPSPIKTH